MFWQAPSYSQPSPIEQILEKDKFTLEELLNEDDLIQEAKSLNGRLIDFLKQPAQVSQLLSYVVEPAAPGYPPPSPHAVVPSLCFCRLIRGGAIPWGNTQCMF